MNYRALAENGRLADTANPFVQGNGNAPSGQVAFLMTDIEGSTRLWDTAPIAMREALQRHDNILKEAITDAGGYVFCRAGDSFAAAFTDPAGAFAAAVESQRALRSIDWPVGAELRVRMAIHVGEADERDGNYFGPCLNRCSRLLGLCSGGRIALSDAAHDLVAARPAMELELTDLGVRGLPDLNVPEHVWFCDVGASAHCDESVQEDGRPWERMR